MTYFLGRSEEPWLCRCRRCFFSLIEWLSEASSETLVGLGSNKKTTIFMSIHYGRVSFAYMELFWGLKRIFLWLMTPRGRERANFYQQWFKWGGMPLLFLTMFTLASSEESGTHSLLSERREFLNNPAHKLSWTWDFQHHWQSINPLSYTASLYLTFWDLPRQNYQSKKTCRPSIKF